MNFIAFTKDTGSFIPDMETQTDFCKSQVSALCARDAHNLPVYNQLSTSGERKKKKLTSEQAFTHLHVAKSTIDFETSSFHIPRANLPYILYRT